MTLVNAQHITASVFINDDESGLHHDYQVWFEDLAPHAPVSQRRPTGRAGPGADRTTVPARLTSGKPLSWTKGQAADAHLKGNATCSVARDWLPSEALIVAVTNDRLDFGTWERNFRGQAEWLARES